MYRLAVLLALLIAAPASAAPLVERPFEPRPDHAVATCVRATGVPGGLAILGPVTRRDAVVELLTAGPQGTSVADRVALGRPLVDCAGVAEAPGGAAVVAGPVAAGRRSEVRAAVRDPGGGVFGAPVRLAEPGGLDTPVAVAVSPSGHAVVAWVARTDVRSFRATVRVMAARRAPGGTFAAAQPLTPWTRGSFDDESEIAVAVDAAGVATVAWNRAGQVEVATAAPGGALRAQRLGPGQGAALAVAPDGRALLADERRGTVRVRERPPGATSFSAPVSVGEAYEPTLAVAIGNGGGAVVAWRDDANAETAGVVAAVRPGAGPFATAEVFPGVEATERSSLLSLYAVAGFPIVPQDPDNGRLRVALAPDGRALLGWTAGTPLVPMVATGTLDAGFAAPVRHGSTVRDANGVAPLFLADGAQAMAWTDNAGPYDSTFAERDGRLHMALEGAQPEPRSPAPRLRLRAAGTQRLFLAQSARVTAECDRACDLRVATRPGQDASTLSLPAGEPGRIRLAPDVDQDNRRRQPLRVRVRAVAPGGGPAARESVTIRIVTRRSPPVPPPVDVRARRRDGAIVVSWRTAVPARRAYYAVQARTARRRQPRDFRSFGAALGSGRQRFTVRLRPRRPEAIRWVAVSGSSLDSGPPTATVVARVRGTGAGAGTSGGRSSASA